MSGWLVVMHTYLYYFLLSLSLCPIRADAVALFRLPGCCLAKKTTVTVTNVRVETGANASTNAENSTLNPGGFFIH